MSWQATLEAFRSHGLEDQTAAALMNRVDTKFLVPVESLAQCFGGLTGQYTALQSEGRRQMAYDTLYYDTADRQHYRDHHNGKLNRLKVRIRQYQDSGHAFLEIKRKNNKGRTIKDRRYLGQERPGLLQLRYLMNDLLGLPATRMSPALFVQYHRATLMSYCACERVTVDTGLTFVSAINGCGQTLNGLAVLELKAGSRGLESPVFDRLKALGCRPVSFSKYCIGTALLEPEQVKTNRFKPVLSRLAGKVSYLKEPLWNRPSIPISSFG